MGHCCRWWIGLRRLFCNGWRGRAERFWRGLIPSSRNIPERGAILRAMLLGDRSFVDSSVVLAFQKTAAYHVLVVAGLHVGALVIFLFWIGRRLRLPVSLIGLVTLLALVLTWGSCRTGRRFCARR